ncbi:hypothetical protein AN958_03903 [Leucoagaricus sp. SymC.cos]|nr:hypothetical protein AN958_03903 [Leucoagaricus sp. SymC.cos]
MDALVHVLYEVGGTIGAFSSSVAISRWGNNFSFFLSPVFFIMAAGIWVTISTLNHTSYHREDSDVGLGEVEGKSSYLTQIIQGTWGFVQSIWIGGALVLFNRRFICSALALYLHRFLESTLAPAFAKRVLNNSSWSQIIVGGSNFGELLGALSVFFLSDLITTPLPWLRLDAIALNLVWLLPYYSTRAVQGDAHYAWRIAACFIPISYAWAAGDVSLSAYIQAALSENQITHKNISLLGAVMAFLYSTYIVLYAILGTVLGKIIDNDFVRFGNIQSSLVCVGG